MIQVQLLRALIYNRKMAVGLKFFKKGKCSELNFRNFWPGSRHLRPSRPNFQPHRTVEYTSQKSVSLQPPFTLKLRPKGAKTTAGLVPATSDRFQTVQTQLGFQPELLVFQTIFNSMPLSLGWLVNPAGADGRRLRRPSL